MFFIVCGVVRALENPLPSGALSNTRVSAFSSLVRFARTGEQKKDSVCLPFTQTTQVEILCIKIKL